MTYGYAGKILKVDLSAKSTSEIPTANYADFLGGRGIAAKIYWDEVPPEVKAFDAENRLIFATGPFAGLPIISGSRWTVCGKSALPAPESFCYCGMGGTWGAELKFAGYDVISVHGKSEKPVYLYIHDGVVEFKDASHLWGRGSIETREILKSELGSSARVVAIGPAGENMVVFASLLADNDASGSGGMGATMGSKRLKAIVVRGSGKRVEIAQPEKFRELANYYRQLSTNRIVLRISPNRYSSDPLGEIRKFPGYKDMKRDRCYGCFTGCARLLYEAQDGKKGKFMCHSGMFYQPRAERYYGDWNDVPFITNRLCNDYGLDTKGTDLIIGWLDACYKAGVLTDENTGIPISKIGSLEFIETLVKKISLRDGIGDAMAQGLDKAGDAMGPEAKVHARHDYLADMPGYVPYSPKIYITNALIYAMEPRIPIQQIHEAGIVVSKWVAWARNIKGGISSDTVRAIAKRFWGGELAGDFSTYEGKAMAVRMIQDREYAKECLILCDFLWPILDLANTQDHVGDPTLESKLLSAVTGNEIDEQELYKIGAKVLNLQRAILVREHNGGREFDELYDKLYTVPLEMDTFNIYCQVPGKDGEIASRKGAVVDKEKFEHLKSEYYAIRQWDAATGLQTRSKLEEIGLKDVADGLEQRGLLAS